MHALLLHPTQKGCSEKKALEQSKKYRVVGHSLLKKSASSTPSSHCSLLCSPLSQKRTPPPIHNPLHATASHSSLFTSFRPKYWVPEKVREGSDMRTYRRRPQRIQRPPLLSGRSFCMNQRKQAKETIIHSFFTPPPRSRRRGTPFSPKSTLSPPNPCAHGTMGGSAAYSLDEVLFKVSK